LCNYGICEDRSCGKKKKEKKMRKEKKRKEKETWYLQSDLGLVGRYQAVPGA